ncbi:rhodanese-like domain-containing protein [Paenibacillus apiarius]|uniref:Rhodanese-like domain-containing protein n=1 Tax=Paenibacillus apiarius TaxID=46240 RepID=A0ABT4DSV9_9BACL|nr:rhodanese-like domain-containing protein [Paenibacillus apiarius]MCY9515757.1 rhodanese-like domain-containing protein [Paenibacillus apiarius]MCY9520429.1 rhodanese-like domain-containing protein [Paenibacillus apiarius]MCY9555469.1 rhodanese-like domain-containing protein [Paenibacillus apiarius]MCY9559083.1 rhodanese-like domain-containing protein [Paenibacillus apiarius]MCY9685664.1 rhodanese-like domain-containing protein [Paenibacillus apiarius]
MNWWIELGALVSLFLIISRIWQMRPVAGLTYVTPTAVCEFIQMDPAVKLIDIRDPADYMECHLEGSTSIYVGRLPYVWRKELSVLDSVVILGSSAREVRKAARILKRRGFVKLYAVRAYRCQPCAGEATC